jgi:hypothetical protein
MPNEFIIKNGFRSQGNSEITGSLNVSAGITGSLQGTASFATTASVNTNGNPLIGGSITSGQVAFGTAAGVIGGDSELFWDNVNKRLGIGTSAPSALLQINGSVSASSAIARGGLVAPTLTASANNDVLVGLDINPTFNNGVFTGVQQESLVIRGGTNPILRFKNAAGTSIWGQFGANISELYFNAQAGALSFVAGNTEAIKVFPSTRNVMIQNGGTFTDSGAKLHVQAQGALSTDIAFRVRNSADTLDFLNVAGNGNFNIGASNVNKLSNINGTAELFGTISARLVGGGTTHDRSLFISSTDIWLRHTIVKHQIGGSSVLWKSTYNGNNSVFELIESTKQSNILVIGNGTGIVSNPIYTDAFQLYSADITAGNAAPYFRTENGSVIKLYQQSAVTSSQGLADVLTNVGLLTTGSSIAAAYERLSDFQSPYHYSGNATLGTSTSSTSWIINRIDFTTPGSPITLQGTGSWDNRTSLIYL